MNQVLEQFGKQPLPVRIGLLLMIVVIIAILEHQLFYVPLDKQLKSLQKTAEDKQLDLAENQAVADNLPKFQEEVNVLNEQLKQAVSLLPNEANIQDILRQFTILTKKANVNLLLFRPGAQRKKGFYSEISMDLKLSGSYHDVATFFDQIGKVSRIINISGIVFSGILEVNNSSALRVDCRATTFMFVGGR